jgi:hypothetical protein
MRAEQFLGSVLDLCGPTVAWLFAFTIVLLARLYPLFFVLAAISHVAIEFKIATKYIKPGYRSILVLLFSATISANILEKILL